MGQALYAAEPAARAVFDRADHLLGFPLTRLCFEGPEAALTDTLNQQPALYTAAFAAWRSLQAAGEPPPNFVAGHSLGEFTALAVAGALEFEAGLALVRRRAELMQAAGQTQPGAMAAVLGLEAETVAALCQQASQAAGRPVQIANDNCPGQLVISGAAEALAEAGRLAEAAGARRVLPLPITIAAHSPLMGPAAADFAQAVDATPFAAPAVPVIANASAEPLTTAEAIRAELKAQLTAPVRWADSMRFLLAQGVTAFVEVGPGEVLLGLMKRIERSVERRKAGGL